MNKGFLDFILSISEDNYTEFMKKTDLDIELDNGLEFTPLNHSWIDVVERYIPFLKNAVDNPYQELIDVADSKKLYENRFLISLILLLDEFVVEKYNEVVDRLSNSYERNFCVKGETNFDTEKLEIELKIKSTRQEDLDNGLAYGLSAKERIERLIEVIQAIIDSQFFNSLKDIKLVSSPIHRTNVILEDQNFKKLLELWDFLDNYILVQKTVLSKKVQAKQQENFHKKVKNACFVNYKVFNGMSEITSASEDYYRDFLEKIIENLVAESTMDDKSFKKLVNKKFEEAYSKKQSREKNIQSIFNKSIDTYQKQIKDAIRCLK